MILLPLTLLRFLRDSIDIYDDARSYFILSFDAKIAAKKDTKIKIHDRSGFQVIKKSIFTDYLIAKNIKRRRFECMLKIISGLRYELRNRSIFYFLTWSFFFFEFLRKFFMQFLTLCVKPALGLALINTMAWRYSFINTDCLHRCFRIFLRFLVRKGHTQLRSFQTKTLTINNWQLPLVIS